MFTNKKTQKELEELRKDIKKLKDFVGTDIDRSNLMISFIYGLQMEEKNKITLLERIKGIEKHLGVTFEVSKEVRGYKPVKNKK